MQARPVKKCSHRAENPVAIFKTIVLALPVPVAGLSDAEVTVWRLNAIKLIGRI